MSLSWISVGSLRIGVWHGLAEVAERSMSSARCERLSTPLKQGSGCVHSTLFLPTRHKIICLTDRIKYVISTSADRVYGSGAFPIFVEIWRRTSERLSFRSWDITIHNRPTRVKWLSKVSHSGRESIHTIGPETWSSRRFVSSTTLKSIVVIRMTARASLRKVRSLYRFRRMCRHW